MTPYGVILIKMTRPLPDIKKTIILNASLEKVWKAVSTSEGIASWWMENNFEPVEGKEFLLHAGTYGDSSCQVTRVEPMKLIEFNWDKDWHITFELKDLGNNQTKFTLTHGGWDADKKTRFNQGHTVIRDIMDGGWEKNIKKILPESIPG